MDDEERVSRSCQCGESATGVSQQFVDYGWTFKCRTGAGVGLGQWLCMSCSAKEAAPKPSQSVSHPVREATRLAIESADVTRGRLLGAIDREFVVMSDVVDLLHSLEAPAIERIIGYLKSRYL